MHQLLQPPGQQHHVPLLPEEFHRCKADEVVNPIRRGAWQDIWFRNTSPISKQTVYAGRKHKRTNKNMRQRPSIPLTQVIFAMSASFVISHLFAWFRKKELYFSLSNLGSHSRRGGVRLGYTSRFNKRLTTPCIPNDRLGLRSQLAAAETRAVCQETLLVGGGEVIPPEAGVAVVVVAEH